MAHDVFISYSTKDKVIADAVCAKLEQNRIRVWIAPRDVPAGANFASSIIRAVNSCKVFVLIWSANTDASGHILNEINQAFDKGITIIPFRIQDVQPTDEMRYYFGRTHWLDAITPPLEQHIATLRDAILVNLGRELKPEPVPEAPPPLQRQPEAKAKPARPRDAAPPPKKPEEKAAAPLAPAARPAGVRKFLPLVIGALVVVALGVGGALFWQGKGNRPATPTATAEGMRIAVTSAEDGGPGTLREALSVAKSGNTITFDAAAFPPASPVTIILKSGLPPLLKGDLTLDASNAGVILDGSQAAGMWTPGIEIDSTRNVVKGLQIVGFSGPGLSLSGNARFTTVGGDREVGNGPIGEGNLLSGNSDGIFIYGSDNIITGNLIGTDSTGSGRLENRASGIVLTSLASRNTIGPNNVIAYNGPGPGGDIGIHNMSRVACGNLLTANSIHDNSATSPEIWYAFGPEAPCAPLAAPAIHYFDLESGVVSGQTCAECTVEIFSTQAEDGEIYEGSVAATEFGNFTFEKGAALSGPFLTATASQPGENTSEFSQPTLSRSAIGMALGAIQDQPPIYQTSFDPGDLEALRDGGMIEDGKLILAAEAGESEATQLSDLLSDRYAVEFEFQVVSGTKDVGHCVYQTSNDYDSADPRYRTFSAYFMVGGRAALSHYLDADNYPDFAADTFDSTRPNTVSLIVLKDQIAAFINRKPLYAVLDPVGSEPFLRHGLSAEQNAVCEFDNFKIWSLEGLDLTP